MSITVEDVKAALSAVIDPNTNKDYVSSKTVKNIRVGPSIPGFLTENLVNILSQEFGLTPISTVEADLKSMLKAA